MKVGFIGFIYPIPEEVTEPLDKIMWQVRRAAELGCTVFQPSMQIPDDDRSIGALGELIREKGIELEIGAPRDIFELTSDHAGAAREAVKRRIEMAGRLGVKILRNGYGRLTAATSRFSREVPGKEQLASLVGNLREAGKLFEDNGVYYALENHCDFTGRELAEVFEAVNSRHVGCALDTANGYTVYCDPNDDVEALARYAVTTHIKDMAVVDFKSDPQLIPFQARGCALGEGNVDIPRAVRLLDEQSPHANGLHLIVEQGWLAYESVTDRKELDRKTAEKSIAYLRKIVEQG